MGLVEIRDHAIWIKHIHGDNDLVEKLSSLTAGSLIELEIDGVKGIWKKMDDGKDGRPTNGIKGLGKGKNHWHGLQDRRGDLVTIKEA